MREVLGDRRPRAWAAHGAAPIHSDHLVLVDRAARIRAYHRASDQASRRQLDANLRGVLGE